MPLAKRLKEESRERDVGLTLNCVNNGLREVLFPYFPPLSLSLYLAFGEKRPHQTRFPPANTLT